MERACPLKIVEVECRVLLVPDPDPSATSSAQDEFLIIIRTTDPKIYGVGESDANPWVLKACVEAPSTHTMGLSLRDMLIGEDPFNVEKLWSKMYVGSYMNGRRGAMIHAMGAIEMALMDIKGKAHDVPAWKLLGKEVRPDGKIRPYASLQPELPHGQANAAAYRESLVGWVEKARRYGFSAAKAEVTLSGPFAHMGMNEPDKKITEVVKACREAAGDAFTLMVDVQYTWDTAERALNTLRDWKDLNIFFCETPLPLDDLPGYARLHKEAPTRIAAGEMQCHSSEFLELLDIGLIDVAQPDVGRVGGLLQCLKVCDYARDRNRLIVPHCWKTGVGIAASAHMAAVTPHCQYIEFLPAELCNSVLRRDLTINDELVLQPDGSIPIPRRPGLGVELNERALELYDVKNFDLRKYEAMAKQAAEYASNWSTQTVVAMGATQPREWFYSKYMKTGVPSCISCFAPLMRRRTGH
eukprot:TRINITY_DN42691_c0_g1_i1.p1 TRINITY_DN42691_c0_g1~~TRINITY_DN42691_c0_g1_i1.p1  ORF type:complete len:469 (-),score=68.10 TRINITY_DN42691_c0_g1_i1:173-1579(-)